MLHCNVITVFGAFGAGLQGRANSSAVVPGLVNVQRDIAEDLESIAQASGYGFAGLGSASLRHARMARRKFALRIPTRLKRIPIRRSECIQIAGRLARWPQT